MKRNHPVTFKIKAFSREDARLQFNHILKTVDKLMEDLGDVEVMRSIELTVNPESCASAN